MVLELSTVHVVEFAGVVELEDAARLGLALDVELFEVDEVQLPSPGLHEFNCTEPGAAR